MSAAIAWKPLDDGARAGRSVLLRAGNMMALGRWDGTMFVYPATGGFAVEFEPTDYYDPADRTVGAFHA